MATRRYKFSLVMLKYILFIYCTQLRNIFNIQIEILYLHATMHEISCMLATYIQSTDHHIWKFIQETFLLPNILQHTAQFQLL